MRNIFDVLAPHHRQPGRARARRRRRTHPTIAQKKEFTEYRRQVEILRGLLAEGKNNMEAYMNLLAYQSKCAEIAPSAVAGEKALIKVVAPRRRRQDARRSPTSRTGRASRSCRSPSRRWSSRAARRGSSSTRSRSSTRTSEDKHIFTIKEAKDSYRSRQKLKYPDGTTVEDTGRAHVDGYREFKLVQRHAGPPGRDPAPHGLRLRRLRARVQSSTARRSASCRASAPIASTAGATGRR